jgi:thiamine transporter ThiT
MEEIIAANHVFDDSADTIAEFANFLARFVDLEVGFLHPPVEFGFALLHPLVKLGFALLHSPVGFLHPAVEFGATLFHGLVKFSARFLNGFASFPKHFPDGFEDTFTSERRCGHDVAPNVVVTFSIIGISGKKSKREFPPYQTKILW